MNIWNQTIYSHQNRLANFFYASGENDLIRIKLRSNHLSLRAKATQLEKPSLLKRLFDE
jgi:hypothetical protein